MEVDRKIKINTMLQIRIQFLGWFHYHLYSKYNDISHINRNDFFVSGDEYYFSSSLFLNFFHNPNLSIVAHAFPLPSDLLLQPCFVS